MPSEVPISGQSHGPLDRWPLNRAPSRKARTDLLMHSLQTNMAVTDVHGIFLKAESALGSRKLHSGGVKSIVS